MLMWAPTTGHHPTERRACVPGVPRLRRAVFDGRGRLGRQQSRIPLRALFSQLKAGWGNTARGDRVYMESPLSAFLPPRSTLSTAQEQHISPSPAIVGESLQPAFHDPRDRGIQRANLKIEFEGLIAVGGRAG